MSAPDRLPGGPIAAVAVAAGLVFSGALLVARMFGTGRAGAFPTSGALPAPSTLEEARFEERARGAEARRRAEAALAEYRWSDRDAGLVALPIERAIDLAADRKEVPW